MGPPKVSAFLFIFAFAVWVLGTIGFYQSSFVVQNQPWSALSDAAYYSLQLFALQFTSRSQSPLAFPLINIARFLAPLATSSAVILALLLLVRERLVRIRTLFVRNHVIVCGVHEKGIRLIESLCAADYDVIAIEASQSCPYTDSCRESGAILLYGDAREKAVLKRARVHKAKFLAAFSGNDDVNAEIAITAAELTGDRSKRALRCVAQITSPHFYRAINHLRYKRGNLSSIRLWFFNIYASGARLVIGRHPPFSDPASATPPHVMIVGLGRLGQEIVAHTGREWARRRGPGAPPLRISAYDSDVNGRLMSLRDRFLDIETYCDIRPNDIDRHAPAFRPERLGAPTIAYVCLDDDSDSLAAALALHRCSLEEPFEIVVCIMEDKGIARLLERRAFGKGEYSNLQGVEVLDDTCKASEILDRLARIVHDDYRDRFGQVSKSGANVEWHELSEKLKESNRLQADDIAPKLDAIGCVIVPDVKLCDPGFEFMPEELEKLSILEHERWRRERTVPWWRRIFLLERKHPDAIPWTELDAEAQAKDLATVRNIPRLLAVDYLTIHRVSPRESASVGARK